MCPVGLAPTPSTSGCRGRCGAAASSVRRPPGRPARSSSCSGVGRSSWPAWRDSVLAGAKECEAYQRSGMAAVDTMNGRQFQFLLEHLFAKKGYRVARLRVRGDSGADLLLDLPHGRTIVQVEHWSGMVRHEAVHQAVVAKARYGVARALVVTSSNYSADAVAEANSNGVTLWNRAFLAAEALLVSRRLAPVGSETVLCGLAGRISHHARFLGDARGGSGCRQRSEPVAATRRRGDVIRRPDRRAPADAGWTSGVSPMDDHEEVAAESVDHETGEVGPQTQIEVGEAAESARTSGSYSSTSRRRTSSSRSSVCGVGSPGSRSLLGRTAPVRGSGRSVRAVRPDRRRIARTARRGSAPAGSVQIHRRSAS